MNRAPLTMRIFDYIVINDPYQVDLSDLTTIRTPSSGVLGSVTRLVGTAQEPGARWTCPETSGGQLTEHLGRVVQVGHVDEPAVTDLVDRVLDDLE